MEMLAGRHFEITVGQLDLTSGILAGIEESLEMESLILLIYTILYLLKTDYRGFSIRLDPNK